MNGRTPGPPSRRAFLSSLGLAGGYGAAFAAMQALDLLPAVAAAAQPEPPQPGRSDAGATGGGPRVVVLGAGIAGLVAAYELRQLGYRVRVLEARSRPGGRNWTVRGGTRVEFTDGTVQRCAWDDGLYMNAGPGRIPSIHGRLLGYCRAFGVPLEVEINSSRSALMQSDALNGGRPVQERRVVYDGRGAIAELLTKAVRQDALDVAVTPEDKDRLLEFLRKFGDLGVDGRYAGSPRAGFAVAPGAGAAEGVPHAPLSLRELLASDFTRGTFYEDQINWQATMLQPVGGMDRIAYAFADRLRDVVTYDAPIREVRKTADGVRVVYARGGGAAAVEALEAELCVCTLPATVMRQLPNDFSPAHRAAIATFRLSSSYKIGWQAPRFWETEDHIYGGISFLQQPVDLVWYPSATLGARDGILLGGFGNETELDGTPTAFGRLGTWEAKLAASRAAVEHLHPGRGRLLLDPIIVSWNHVPYSLGCVGNNKPEERGAYDQLNAPDGPVIFAGDYLSHVDGWQEGAVYSAHRAVELVRRWAGGST